MNHKLFNQLSEANVTEDEIAELFDDLKFIFENPFDCLINDAVSKRGCLYIEQPQPMAN